MYCIRKAVANILHFSTNRFFERFGRFFTRAKHKIGQTRQNKVLCNKNMQRLRNVDMYYEVWEPKYLTIYEKAISHIWLCNRSYLNFLIYEAALNPLSNLIPATGSCKLAPPTDKWGNSLRRGGRVASRYLPRKQVRKRPRLYYSPQRRVLLSFRISSFFA